MEAYTLNSFAKNKTGGNPAGVVLNADSLTDKKMQEIAKYIGVSETAFVSKSNKADFKLRFFTPSEEVDLCGHATIGAFFLMKEKNYLKPGRYSQETKAGILNITIDKSGEIFMEQTLPKFYDKLNDDDIAKSLNIEKLNTELPVQIVSTGLKDILIPVTDLKALFSIKPDFDLISRISKKYGAIGYHVFTLETLGKSTAHCRNFAPLVDIPEESATGTSNGALACYFFKYNKISGNMKFEQGNIMGRPSIINVKLSVVNNKISKVYVGGKAANIKIKTLPF